MSNPIILADNRFLDGTPTATDTAAGYSVLNISDLREFLSWKAESAGTKYLSVYTVYGYTANALGIKNHNMGTAEASVSVESSSDSVAWTERLAPFTPSDDKAILKLFALATAAYWRVKIVTASVAAEVSVCMVGETIEFPFPPDGPYIPLSSSVEAEKITGKTGVPLGSIIRFKPYKISPRWSWPLRTWVETYFLPFWDDYASNLAQFFYAWDLATYPNDVRFVSVPAGHSFEAPMSVLPYYDSIALPMEGVIE